MPHQEESRAIRARPLSPKICEPSSAFPRENQEPIVPVTCSGPEPTAHQQYWSEVQDAGTGCTTRNANRVVRAAIDS